MSCDSTLEERCKRLRESATNIHALLCNTAEQLEYERDVPIANVPSELQCQWFDDFYHHRDLGVFRTAFTPTELVLLAEFDAFFRAHDPLLPKDPESIQTWLDDPTWREIMAKAEETLRRWRELNPEQ